MTGEDLYNYMIKIQTTNEGTCNKRVRTLCEEDLARPLVGRDKTVASAAEFYKANDRAYKEGRLIDRNNFQIPACATIPGMGKTHMLNTMGEILKQAGVGTVHLALIVQYFNGQSLQWIDRLMSVECAFCWRMLFVVFAKDHGWTFQAFCCQKVLPSNADLLTLSVTLQAVRCALENDGTIRSDTVMILSLGIDEFQKIGVTEAEQEKKLAELCMTLYENSYTDAHHLYPLFAGTDWTRIQQSGRSSGLPVNRLPMPLLNTYQVEKLVKPLLKDLYFTSPLVRKHLFVLGSLPRAALMYSKDVAKHAVHGEPSEEQLSAVYNEVRRSFARIWQDYPSLQAKLLALCFTMTNVTNGYDVTYTDAGVAKSVNVRRLADAGYCLINTMAGTELDYVSVPYLLMHLFAKCHVGSFTSPAELCLLRSVQWMIKNVDECLYAKPRWEQSEDFGCAYMACRMNSFQVLGCTTLTVEELWTGALCNVPEDWRLKLRPTEVVRTSIQLNKDMLETIPELGTSRTINWLRGSEERGQIFRNGVNGAETDNFFSLPVADVANEFVPFLEQTKDVASRTISPAKVGSLCEAQSTVCPVGLTAIRCLRNSIPRLGSHVTAEQLPKNCIAILRGQLRSFYGMFADHPAATAHVNINECNRAQLKSLNLKMAGGSMEAATTLVWNRVQESTFASEAEFKAFLDSHGIEIPPDDMECILAET